MSLLNSMHNNMNSSTEKSPTPKYDFSQLSEADAEAMTKSTLGIAAKQAQFVGQTINFVADKFNPLDFPAVPRPIGLILGVLCMMATKIPAKDGQELVILLNSISLKMQDIIGQIAKLYPEPVAHLTKLSSEIEVLIEENRKTFEPKCLVKQPSGLN